MWLHGIVSSEDIASASGLPRSHGHASASFERGRDNNTQVKTLFQEGCLKLRLPRAASDGAELVVINTAGGLTGGDAISIDVTVGEEAHATVTTPGSERIYRSLDGDAVMKQSLTVRRGGRLDWLPQETILYDRGRLRRRFDVEVGDDAEATLVEAVLLGRTAMGETVQSGFLSDFWTVRRGDRLLFADATRITDPFAASVGNVATLHGRTALAMLIHVGDDLAAKCDALRAGFAEAGDRAAGASIIGDVLVTRIAASGILPLRRALIPALSILRDSRPLPRLWTC
jgi:urease accessory protein